MYGGTSEPCGNAYFMCIGKMGVEENKQHAAKLYPLFDKLFGIKNDRYSVHYLLLVFSFKVPIERWTPLTFEGKCFS